MEEKKKYQKERKIENLKSTNYFYIFLQTYLIYFLFFT